MGDKYLVSCSLNFHWRNSLLVKILIDECPLTICVRPNILNRTKYIPILKNNIHYINY